MKKNNGFTLINLIILIMSMFLILSTASCEITEFLDLFSNQGTNNNTNNDDNDDDNDNDVNNPLYCNTSICPGSTSISLGDTAPLDITGVSPRVDEINWYVNNGPGSGIWNPSGQNQVIEDFTPDSPGMYNMTVNYLLAGFTCSCDFTIEVIKEPENNPCNDNFNVEVTETTVPVDIVMIIDNSGSMVDEINAVRTYINKLSNQMESLDVDYHFIMISRKVGNNSVTHGIKVPPPLGTSNRFKHIDVKVGSKDSLSLIKYHFSKYKSFLRNNAMLNFIIITDDNSKSSFNNFKNSMAEVGKPIFRMHGIIGLPGGTNISSVGKIYIKGIIETGGVKLSISTPASQWGTLFDKLSNNIIQQATHDTYFLTNNPVINNLSSPEDSFIVSINGQQILSNYNWVYDQANNSITFLNLYLLKANDIIKVEYETGP